MVVLREQNTPPTNWRLGKIVKVYRKGIGKGRFDQSRRRKN